jgi:hypothetical protein
MIRLRTIAIVRRIRARFVRWRLGTAGPPPFVPGAPA